jgi:hypothetical protein
LSAEFAGARSIWSGSSGRQQLKQVVKLAVTTAEEELERER